MPPLSQYSPARIVFLGGDASHVSPLVSPSKSLGIDLLMLLGTTPTASVLLVGDANTVN
jgi:hypothetical protein